MEPDNPVTQQLLTMKEQIREDLKFYFDDFLDLHDRKLWHQLTLKLEKFVLDPNSGPYLLPFFEHFVKTLQSKINPLKYVSIALVVAHQCENSARSIEFLNETAEKMDAPSSREAHILASMEIASHILLSGSSEGVKAIVEKCQEALDRLPHVETIIYAHFYRVAAELYKAQGDFAKYYNHSLLYLSCINVEDLLEKEKVSRAYDLSLSALLGDTIYNFGELLMHPVSESLKDSEHDWLYKLLLVFNRGEIGKFDSLVPHFSKQPLLETHMESLKKKLILMALVEYIFNQKTDSRVLSFQSIAQECRITLIEVEHVIMRALSLGLIKGSIDQVTQTVSVSWVQPRYLDKTQLSTLHEKLKAWSCKADTIYDFIQTLNPEIVNPQ
ncbi:26S proteasome regulatory subunit [Entomophthora muscae]|uniref:26S proteasome regulatory subunit n=1 Tax=Entomophthora muscae TaxID=34485 RepID=A0ACC2S5N6_9FUNG|nr:26S proteasome regulatory subunit [Entomophthora muscae]